MGNRSRVSSRTCLFYLSAILLLFGKVVAAQDGGSAVCLMVFQMADNNLESFLEEDAEELIESRGIREDSVTTWVYFDGRNDDGVTYSVYDHDNDEMVVDTNLGEVNSDHPQALYDFVVHALTDCLSRGHETVDTFLILSSHGAGFAGYGGDENWRTRRRLIQSNKNIVYAIESALSEVDGAPGQLDVIGFDACLMSAVLALNEYQKVSKYVLASEATEPGHGWAYRELENVDSALDMAKDFHDTFLQEKQGSFKHQAPKTMALVGTNQFQTFYTALEDLFATMKNILADQETYDEDFHTNLHRARVSSVSFDSYLDNSGGEHPSAVDVGSFLQGFRSLCSPSEDSSLGQLLDTAIDKYNAMFVARGVGPGTPQGTGMHIMWPLPSVYKQKKRIFDGYLFENGDVVDLPPEWLDFMTTYLNKKAPSSSASSASGNGVCGSSTSAGTETSTTTVTTTDTVDTVDNFGAATDETGPEPSLLINPSVQDTGKEVIIQSEITSNTDIVNVEVGIDSSALYNRRQLKTISAGQKRKPPRQSALLDQLRPHRHKNKRRFLQSSGDDYFYLYLATVAGTYNQSQFSAVWDRQFVFLGDKANQDHMPVYVYDEGSNGAKSVPVMYFPPQVQLTRDDIPIGTTLEEAVELGGTFGSLKFGYNSSTGELTTAFSLMTNNLQGSNDGNSTISETLPSAGGQVVPILFLQGRVDGYDYDMFLGGFDRTILRWSDDNPLEITLVSAKRYLDVIPRVNTLLVHLTATDFDATDDTGDDDESQEDITFRINVGSSTAAAMVSSFKALAWVTLGAGSIVLLLVELV
ncbi:peptidase C11 clostripain [Seminavis robusta]|uniref:Peptidase C11 clostripain n=1 Tax=Seminavis robusta TaxID=568900 RepID=A0A9N8H1Y9_9STRA|nr:peptidase C11 clostripain [Seminavis robusta]|eukprot:Sro26_g017440.1 peptidase C11 clostripain (810) ;mRNA; r:8684-11184